MNWPRQYYRSGGGDAFLFYVVYGPVPQDFTISGPKYRVDNIPDGVKADLRDAVIDLINRFIAFQAFGGIIEEGREIRMS